MVSNRLVFAALALACVTAAGAGGYLATRQVNQPTEAAAPVASQTASDAASAPAVRETEAPVTQAAPAAATTVAPTAAPEPSQAAEVPAAAPVSVPTKRTPAPPAASASRAPQAQTRSAQTSVARTPDRPATELPRTVPPTQASAQEPATSTNDLPATSSADNRQSVPDQAPVAEALPSTAVNPVGVGQVNFEELTVSADSVIGLELDRAISSDRARVEDRVEARVARDVRVGRRVAIPAGAKALGSVMTVERGGKFKERARLGIRFNTLVLADGTRLPIQTDTIYRYGDAPGDSSAKKIGGGAVAGAILGAIIGGAKGAAVGATAGAGGGTAMVMSGERSAAEFPTGAEVTARILTPVTVTIER